MLREGYRVPSDSPVHFTYKTDKNRKQTSCLWARPFVNPASVASVAVLDYWRIITTTTSFMVSTLIAEGSPAGFPAQRVVAHQSPSRIRAQQIKAASNNMKHNPRLPVTPT